MKKIKLVKSFFCKEKGYSMVVISTPLGRFMGTASLHEDDKERCSQLAGCEYAEIRAKCKYFKAELKQTRIQLKTLCRLFNIFRNNVSGTNLSSPEFTCLYQEIQKLKNKIAELKNLIKQGEESIQKRDKARQSVYDKIQKRTK